MVTREVKRLNPYWVQGRAPILFVNFTNDYKTESLAETLCGGGSATTLMSYGEMLKIVAS